MSRRLGGFEFTSRETGVEPDIHPSVMMDAQVDCIHKVTIEADAFSGHDIMILTGSHDPTKFGAERRATSGGGPVHIKEGAWLCTRCIIVGPVTIGRHAVVAAGAVVVDDVPDYALVAGVPARVVKFYKADRAFNGEVLASVAVDDLIERIRVLPDSVRGDVDTGAMIALLKRLLPE